MWRRKKTLERPMDPTASASRNWCDTSSGEEEEDDRRNATLGEAEEPLDGAGLDGASDLSVADGALSIEGGGGARLRGRPAGALLPIRRHIPRKARKRQPGKRRLLLAATRGPEDISPVGIRMLLRRSRGVPMRGVPLSSLRQLRFLRYIREPRSDHLPYERTPYS